MDAQTFSETWADTQSFRQFLLASRPWILLNSATTCSLLVGSYIQLSECGKALGAALETRLDIVCAKLAKGALAAAICVGAFVASAGNSAAGTVTYQYFLTDTLTVQSTGATVSDTKTVSIALDAFDDTLGTLDQVSVKITSVMLNS